MTDKFGPLVADTHTFIWYANNSRRLSPRAGEVLDAATASDAPILVSAVTIVELRYLVEKGTLSEAEFEVLVALLDAPDSPYEVAPVDGGIAVEAGQISRKFGADPFDRMIGATAVALGIPLVTADRKLQAQPAVETVW